MEEINLYREKYPQKTMKIAGHDFRYRYFKNDGSEVTFVLLTGGIGLSDLFFRHFTEFAKDYSVITFDYHTPYKDNKQLAQAISILLQTLGVKAYLVGQSLGGFVAQIVAKYYPDVVDGLILSNTGSLSVSMEVAGKRCLLEMMDRQIKMLKLMKFIPFILVKKLMKKAVMKKLDNPTYLEIQMMTDLCDEMLLMLTKKYEVHMVKLLIDLKNYWNMVPEDFKKFEGKVLLILSQDDHTFNENVKKSLISIMPNPEVVTDITGGHLALMLKLDRYADTVRDFVSRAEKKFV